MLSLMKLEVRVEESVGDCSYIETCLLLEKLKKLEQLLKYTIYKGNALRWDITIYSY